MFVLDLIKSEEVLWFDAVWINKKLTKYMWQVVSCKWKELGIWLVTTGS